MWEEGMTSDEFLGKEEDMPTTVYTIFPTSVSSYPWKNLHLDRTFCLL